MMNIKALFFAELFTSVSNGKTAIATAITGKGGTATGSDTFTELATEISNVATWDADLVTSNIKDGVNIFGGSRKCYTC